MYLLCVFVNFNSVLLASKSIFCCVLLFVMFCYPSYFYCKIFIYFNETKNKTEVNSLTYLFLLLFLLIVRIYFYCCSLYFYIIILQLSLIVVHIYFYCCSLYLYVFLLLLSLIAVFVFVTLLYSFISKYKQQKLFSHFMYIYIVVETEKNWTKQ